MSGCADKSIAVTIRLERPDDQPGIHAVHAAAFAQPTEADLVDRLRDAGLARISLVAAQQLAGSDKIIGHVAFSPVTIEHNGRPVERAALALGPMAVLPAYHCRGIGAKLVRAGLETCRKHAVGFVVVLGHPDYYPRFGFRRASRFGLANEYGADDAFMAVELRAGSIPSEGGLIRYSAAFTAVEA